MPQRLLVLFYAAILIGFSANANGIELPAHAEEGHQNFPTLRAATLFLIVGKVVRLGLFVIYGYALPKFRSSMYPAAVFTALFTCVYIPLLTTQSEAVFWAIASVGAASELMVSWPDSRLKPIIIV